MMTLNLRSNKSLQCAVKVTKQAIVTPPADYDVMKTLTSGDIIGLRRFSDALHRFGFT